MLGCGRAVLVTDMVTGVNNQLGFREGVVRFVCARGASVADVYIGGFFGYSLEKFFSIFTVGNYWARWDGMNGKRVDGSLICCDICQGRSRSVHSMGDCVDQRKAGNLHQRL